MIVELILTALFTVVGAVISLFNFPGLPSQLKDAYESIMTYVYAGTDFMFWLFDPTILKLVVALIIGLYVIEKGIDLFLWVWHMLHGSNTSVDQ